MSSDRVLCSSVCAVALPSKVARRGATREARFTMTGMPMNQAPKGTASLPEGFWPLLQKLSAELTPRQRALLQARRERLAAAHQGELPSHLPPSLASGEYQVALPAFCQDQRNQMTGPADDADLVVKMLNSGAPGVMLDLEDSMANSWDNLTRGIDNILKALVGELTYT